jgi:nucleoside-diphosphate-sugar epimerase
MSKILVTGACGQLGSELTAELRNIHGSEQVVATDITDPNPQIGEGPYEHLDVMNRDQIEEVIEQHEISVVYHLAALLSANAEKKIGLAWKLNMDGLLNVLSIARDKSLEKIFWPSSIAVFGPDAQKIIPLKIAPATQQQYTASANWQENSGAPTFTAPSGGCAKSSLPRPHRIQITAGRRHHRLCRRDLSQGGERRII